MHLLPNNKIMILAALIQTCHAFIQLIAMLFNISSCTIYHPFQRIFILLPEMIWTSAEAQRRDLSGMWKERRPYVNSLGSHIGLFQGVARRQANSLRGTNESLHKTYQQFSDAMDTAIAAIAELVATVRI